MKYIPKHFKWYELMPSKEYRDYWLWLMDDRILISLDEIREYYKKPVIVNTWYNGGQFSERGLRPMNTTTGSKFSQHKFGRAVDFHINGISNEKIRSDIKSGLFPLITCIESDVNWVHIDVRNENRLFIVKP